MSDYCQDRDILAIEPVIFLGGGFPAQQLIAGQTGAFAGTTFSVSGGSFTSASVQPGMVLVTYSTIPAEGNACEVISVNSSTQLTVSVLRADTEDAAVAPPGGSDLLFHVRTYAAQIRAVSRTLGEKLRQISEVSPVANADFADSDQLRRATAYGVLTEVFTARAANAEAYDANWLKAQHYRQLFRQAQLQLRLTVDSNGDGQAEQTRSLGNVELRRS